MLLSEELTIKWVANNVKYYTEKGYKYTKTGNEFTVKIEDLNPNCKYKVKVKCDYCLKDYEKQYKMYHRDRDLSPIKKDACKNCGKLKRKETISIKYGWESPEPKVYEGLDIDSKEKRRLTNLHKFGVETPLSLDSIRKKREEAMIEKYGVKSVFELDEFRKKSMKTLHKNGTAPCSKQQKHVHDVIGGELNLPINKLFLDIAFPKDKIYVECDFRGHDLHVRMGNITKEEMDKSEMKRFYMLRDLGWKMVRIISVKDRVPSNDKLLEMIDIAKKELDNHSWIKFDLDNGLIETSNGLKQSEYGILSRI